MSNTQESEKLNSVDQNRFAAVQSLFSRCKRIFIRQGSVVATWRTVVSQSDGATRRMGPYWSLRYRDEGKQRSLYLGRSAALASAVKQMLARLQAHRRQWMKMTRVRAAAAAALRRHKPVWEADLKREIGLTMKGWDIRGWHKWKRRIAAARGQCSPHAPA